MNLKQMRESRGMTQTELSVRTGIQQGYLSSQESGVKNLALDDMVLCERALGVNLEWADRFNTNDKGEILHAMASLMERYPLVVVLEFAKRTLTNRRDTTPIKTLKFVASQTSEEE